MQNETSPDFCNTTTTSNIKSGQLLVADDVRQFTTNEFDGNLDLKGASLRNTLVAGTYVAQYCGGSSF